MRVLVFALSSSMALACSDPADGDPAKGAGGGSSGIGGSLSGSGGAAPALVPLPQGPGLDASVVDGCEEIVCDGTRIGSWELTQRCDVSGTWVDDASSWPTDYADASSTLLQLRPDTPIGAK
jgi:hypothetical protein